MGFPGLQAPGTIEHQLSNEPGIQNFVDVWLCQLDSRIRSNNFLQIPRYAVQICNVDGNLEIGKLAQTENPTIQLELR